MKKFKSVQAISMGLALSIAGIGAAQADVTGAVYLDEAGNPVVQMHQGDIIIQDASTGEFQPVAAGESVTVLPGAEYEKAQGTPPVPPPAPAFAGVGGVAGAIGLTAVGLTGLYALNEANDRGTTTPGSP